MVKRKGSQHKYHSVAELETKYLPESPDDRLMKTTVDPEHLGAVLARESLEIARRQLAQSRRRKRQKQ